MRLILTIAAALIVSSSATAQPPRIPHYSQLMAIARCETGGINGGRPLWTHRSSDYGGALGFRHSTWNAYRKPWFAKFAWNASPRQQLLVGERLIGLFGFTPWPACSVRLGLR